MPDSFLSRIIRNSISYMILSSQGMARISWPLQFLSKREIVQSGGGRVAIAP